MVTAQQGTSELARLGQEIYERDIKAHVEEKHKGEFLALDTVTGGYEIDANHAQAIEQAVSRFGGGRLYIVRIGYPAAARFGYFSSP